MIHQYRLSQPLLLNFEGKYIRMRLCASDWMSRKSFKNSMKFFMTTVCFRLKQVATKNLLTLGNRFPIFLRLCMNFFLYNHEVFVAVYFSTFQVIFIRYFLNFFFSEILNKFFNFKYFCSA